MSASEHPAGKPAVSGAPAMSASESPSLKSLGSGPSTSSSSKQQVRKSVTFRISRSIRYIESLSHQRIQKSSPNVSEQLVVFERFEGGEVTDNMLQEAAQLFNENYGIWGADPTNPGAFPKPGTRVKMSQSRLRSQCLPENAACSYTRVIIDGRLAGNVFTCRWSHDDKTMCWITQLVVHSDFRERGLAYLLLKEIQQEGDSIYGLASSHPAACLAAVKAVIGTFGSNGIDVDFIRNNAQAIMKASPISYIRDAELRGSLFDSEDTSGAISSVNTKFFVDHTEPLEALESIRQQQNWPLGELLEGCEFLLMLEVRRRDRSRSRSSSLPKSQ